MSERVKLYRFFVGFDGCVLCAVQEAERKPATFVLDDRHQAYSYRTIIRADEACFSFEDARKVFLKDLQSQIAEKNDILADLRRLHGAAVSLPAPEEVAI